MLENVIKMRKFEIKKTSGKHVGENKKNVGYQRKCWFSFPHRFQKLYSSVSQKLGLFGKGLTHYLQQIDFENVVAKE